MMAQNIPNTIEWNREGMTVGTLDREAMKACRERIDNLTKPIYSLAQLEIIAERLAGIYKEPKPHDLRYGVILFCADHVGATSNMTHSLQRVMRFHEGRTATQGGASKLKAPVYVVDVGLGCDTSDLSTIATMPVVKGRGSGEQALSKKECQEAIAVGVSWAKRLHREGIEAVSLGHIGEGAYLGALLVTAKVTGVAVDTLLDACHKKLEKDNDSTHIDASMMNETADTIDDIVRLAGADIAALVGFVLGAAACRMAIVFDNAITGAAVVAATAIEPNVIEYVFPSASYDDAVHQEQMKYLQMKPYLYYDVSIDEGLGATMGLSILDASMHMLNDMKTFVEANVAAAEDGPGNERQENPDNYKKGKV